MRSRGLLQPASLQTPAQPARRPGQARACKGGEARAVLSPPTHLDGRGPVRAGAAGGPERERRELDFFFVLLFGWNRCQMEGREGGACARQPPREPEASHQSPLRVTRGGRGCAHRAGVGGPSVTGAARSWLTARRLPAAPQIRPRLGLRQAPPPATAGDPSPQALCHRPLTPPGPATQCGGRGRRAWRFFGESKEMMREAKKKETRTSTLSPACPLP